MLNRVLILLMLAALAALVLSCNRTQTEGKSYSSAGKPASGTVTVAPGTVAAGEEESSGAAGEPASDGEAASGVDDEASAEGGAADGEGAAEASGQDDAAAEESEGQEASGEEGAGEAEESKPEKIPASHLSARMRQVTRAMFETTKGNFIVAIYPEIAPISAPHFIKLIQGGFYDGIVIHRYEPNFVVQAGLVFAPDGSPLYPDDPRKARMAQETIPDEPCLSENTEMTISFAKPDAPNGASCQFFINLGDNRKLDDYNYGFTVMGQVIHGYDVVRKLRVGDKILRAYVLREGGI